jgi:acetamidase/formamidase
VRAGTTIYLPVNVPGALLYLGDGHAAQGEGEIAGTAAEVEMNVVLSVDLIKGRAITTPRLEDDTYLMVAGSTRPLEDAMRIASHELIQWLVTDYGLSALDNPMSASSSTPTTPSWSRSKRSTCPRLSSESSPGPR